MSESSEPVVHIGKHSVKKSDIFKLLGLLFFFVLMAGIIALLWPSLSLLFEDDGVNKVIAAIQQQGPFGVLILLGLQFVQIVVAFIPGEVVQAAAGLLYGPWWGAVIILCGAIVSSAVIYELVHRLGAPFVHAMVDAKYLEKFYEFERSGKLTTVVFILFLIPGMPKDVFTYLVPLTDMRLRTFLIVTTIGRIPGVIITTYAVSDIAEGNVMVGLVIFAIAALVMLVGLIFRNKLLAVLGNTHTFQKHDKAHGGALSAHLEEAKKGVTLDIPGEDHDSVISRLTHTETQRRHNDNEGKEC